ncbi:SHOCT domain-containing protein [uncultured Streptomyces sp.]|uniref:SHOCT domain-containing protein n=1 Tax=uncultured Streptomyces sp. TaxID=174707 RepID=UPI00261B8C25|nr:SHOCT domain-containing protein [uncultured Streptomyces sp.]
MPRRMGRPGLLGTMARTAVITGTAGAVSNRVQERADRRYAQQTSGGPQQYTDPAPVQPPPAPGAGPSAPDRVSQLTALADLKNQGLLTEEEFAAEKAKIINS